MFGTLRFLLALFVALSHMNLIIGYNIGVSAVVVFYMLSGYVMSHSFLNNFRGQMKNLGRFYIDRFLRTYPLYIFYIAITLVFILTTNYGEPEITAFNLIGNLTIIPLNYFMFFDTTVLKSVHAALIPPTWSLGAEWQFYILFPFLIKYKPLQYFAIFLSITVFIAATIGLINTDCYGYRLLPGILFIFLSGSLLYSINHEGEATGPDLWLVRIIALFSAGVIIMLSFTAKIKNLYTLEVMMGFLIGLLTISVLAKIKSGDKIDTFLGNISYPIFLSHFLSMWMVTYFSSMYGMGLDIRGAVVLQLSITILLAYAGYVFVDARFQKYRKHLQARGMLSN